MKKIKIDLKKINNQDIELISKYLLNNKIIAYPTDTIYGLGCIATDKKAIDRIYKIKNKNKNKSLIILVDSIEMCKKYCNVSDKQIKYINKFQSSPVSFILESKNNLPKNLINSDKSIAVRLPKNDFLIKLINKINYPIVSTSLNISNQNHLEFLDGLEKYFIYDKIDLVVDNGKLKNNKASKIIDIRNINNIDILRN